MKLFSNANVYTLENSDSREEFYRPRARWASTHLAPKARGVLSTRGWTAVLVPHQLAVQWGLMQTALLVRLSNPGGTRRFVPRRRGSEMLRDLRESGRNRAGWGLAQPACHTPGVTKVTGQGRSIRADRPLEPLWAPRSREPRHGFHPLVLESEPASYTSSSLLF